MSWGNWDDSKYSRRSSLPPVPEEENDSNENGNFQKSIRATVDTFDGIGQKERRGSIFNKMGYSGGTGTFNAMNRRSWHGDDFGGAMDSYLDDSLTQTEREIVSSRALKNNFNNSGLIYKRVFVVLFLLIVFGAVISVFIWYSLPVRQEEPSDSGVTISPSGEPYCNIRCSDMELIDSCRNIFSGLENMVRSASKSQE